MAPKIVKLCLEALRKPAVKFGDLDNLQRDYTFIVHTRVWAAYIFFNVGLLLPVFIFKVSHAVKVQLNLEVAFFFALWGIFGAWLRKRALRWFAAVFGVFYVIAIIYETYAGALSGLYQRDANFFNDFSFVFGGMSFLLEALNLPLWVYLLSGIAIFVLIGLIFWLARSIFVGVPVSELNGATRYGFLALGLMAILVSVISPKQTADLQTMVSSLTVEIIANFQRSLETRDYLETFVTLDPTDSYDYTQYPISETPDVFFIFIESYGSVVYKREHFTSSYLEMAEALERRLVNEQWAAVSTISEAPTWGGGSWMSYTSTLFGVRVDQQSEYDALKKKFSILEYPNIGRYFSSQGYDYVWVVPINRQLPEKSQAIDHRFYGADHWITFDTLDYQGPLFGWGPSPPDQFTFGFIQEFVAQQNQPTFLVYLTQNSHYPWTPLPPILENWRDLENLDMQDGVLSEAQKKGLSLGESRQNYLQALENTLNVLEEFITSLDNKNSIIVLIGDHPPPSVSRREDGFGTMVHIISQDVEFLNSFYEYGFVDGLVLENLESTLRHEGVYSLFVRNFIARYGARSWMLPPYLPNGHQ